MRKKLCWIVVLSLSVLGSIVVPSRYGVMDLPLRSYSHLKIAVEIYSSRLGDLFFVLTCDESQFLFRKFETDMVDKHDMTNAYGGWDYGELGPHITLEGCMYVIPKWQDNCLMRNFIPYSRHGIHVGYDPFNETLFLSEDIAELGYDFSKGFCVPNIPPSFMKINMDFLERISRNEGDETESWKYKGYKRKPRRSALR